MLNKVQIIGRLGRDPEGRSFQNGGKVVNMNVATSEKWKDRNSGEQREKTEWHNVAIFAEHTANFVEQYVKKGDLVYIEGQLETRKWQDQSGADRYSTEVVVRPYKGSVQKMAEGGSGSSGGSSGGQSGYGGGGNSGGGYGGGGTSGGQSGYGSSDNMDDEIPF